MKKKVLSGLFALALLVATGYGVNQSMKSDANLPDLALANVEALAQSEEKTCPAPCIDDGSGCYCYGWYSYCREPNW
ncbi:MAG: hypothetical protein XD92_0052 [Proteiniphilum acetatigenes]|jgi:hypothetical protein|uniref:Uncharacterized protein n=1 Tax=Proteiniphilum acetatigenes TaxID=294710 RepID=A0A101HL12_9BACT|nr:MAG: hypothetical protein XD92_0052 [Proteiniphilum acetatigenes]HCC85760.1 hypothetical protein [Porphyromonadaceae bacterium]